MLDPIYDLVIIGGGINGAGIAADAAGRGLKVVLLEMGDLGGATSSASSKLIHGGLRYLEHCQFHMVREALEEREILLTKAPHIIWPMRFVLPHTPGMRSRVLLRTGLFLYDYLAKRRRMPASRTLDLARDPAGGPLAPKLKHGLSYWDCWVDDARLVVLNARAAAAKGARIETRTKVIGLAATGDVWRVSVQSTAGGSELSARAVVNAAGPWSDSVARLAVSSKGVMDGAQMPRLRLVKGSHIVVPRISGADDAYLMQSRDGRVVFVLPFEERFSLVGTTDEPYEGDPAQATISRGEEDYLLALVNEFFAQPISRNDVVWSYSGVRPLYDDKSASPSAVTRDYRLELVNQTGTPALLNVIGGKVTTYRRLAEAALRKLEPQLPAMKPPWTAAEPLPGGDFGAGGVEAYRLDLGRRRPWLPRLMVSRLIRRYGTLSDELLGDARALADLGPQIGGGLSAREVVFLKDQEWSRTADDVLWRRTKAGLHMTPEQRARAAEEIDQLL